jgi:endothelin-converting enzyme
MTSTTYSSSLSPILEETESDVIEAYLVTRAALALAPYLGATTEVWKANRELEETLQGIKKGQVPDRSNWCIQRVESSMGFAAGRYFVQKTFGGDSKEKATKVIISKHPAYFYSNP